MRWRVDVDAGFPNQMRWTFTTNAPGKMFVPPHTVKVKVMDHDDPGQQTHADSDQQRAQVGE
jgi:hypothetical protein